MKFSTLTFSTILALAGSQALAQTNELSSLSIGTAVTAGGTANGVATLTQRIGTAGNAPGSIGNNLAGLQYVAGQVPLDGAPASVAFFTLTGAAVPGGAGNPATAFESYATLTTPTTVVTYGDAASKLTPDSYSALTFSAADLGFGASNFYMIHHAPNNVDYWAEIVPGTGTSTAIADLKPMSWQGPTAGTPASPGKNGYFGLTWATGILSLGAPYADQSMYYLRTDASSHTQFGVMIPALTGASTDTLDLTTAVGSWGVGGYTTLAFVPTNAVGNYPTNNFYYLRLDPMTGNTVLGRLNPDLSAGARTISDIANLGGVYNTLNYASDATGPAGAWGTTQFYVTGSSSASAQSVSFEAIPNHNVGDIFTITPTASSNLDIDVTVVSGPATVITTGVSGASPSLRIFTVTTTGPGIVTLQATQAGRTATPAFTTNMLQQTFDVLGLGSVTSSPTAAGTANVPFTYDITATGSPMSYSASPLPPGLSVNTVTGAITGTPTTAGVTIVTLTATNASGTSLPSTVTITIAPAGVAPVITSSNAAAGTVGTAFSYSITATGAPTSYSASPLPAGLSVDTVGGAITGTPTTAGVTVVTLGATNASGTGNATLTITIAALGVAPVITSPPTAAGTVGTVFATYTIVATGSPTSYSAIGLPGGLTLNAATGTIDGTPTAAGPSVVTLGATNASGTGNATLTITIAPAGAAPVITSPNTAAGTAGMVFVTYQIVATGTPTSYSAVGLPAGLALNTVTGTINGTPTSAGTSVVTLGATNGSGTGNATLTITVAAAGTPPVITSPAVAAGTVGTAFVTYSIVATGSPLVYTAVVLPPGLTLNTVTGTINGTPTAMGTTVVTLGATNGFGTGTENLTITIAAAGVVPVITFPAVTGDTASGQVGTVFETYTIAATGSPSSYSAAGLPPGLAVDSLTGAINGTPTQAGTFPVTISATNATGTGSATLTITVVPAAFSQIINFSARAFSGVGSDTLIVGFGISGNGMNLLVRGIGPGLQQFGVSNYLPNPILTLYDNSGAVEATDAGWEVNSSGQNDGSLIASTAAEAGAFPLAANSTDSALLVTVPSGVHTTGLLTTNGAEGVGLIEIYDVGGNRFASLTNVSARMEVTPGDGVLIAGLVIVGNAPKTVLIRGVGPTLSDFGVTGALADPSITVFSGATQVASNTGWGTGSNNVSQIVSVSAQVGAFALPTGSNDCALLLTLQPGAYTVVVTSVSNSTGVALIEVYDTQ